VEKIWLKSYPEGVPDTVDMDEFSSIKDILEQSCARYRDLTAYSNMGARLSYGDIDQQSRYFAAFLQKRLGLQKGDRVAIMSPNLLQYPIALFGVLRAGMVVVNVNPLYTPRELEHQLKDSGAKAIVILENFCATLEEVLERTEVETVITSQIGDMLPLPKSMLINVVVKYVKKMVPAWRIDGSIPFKKSLAEGKWETLDDVTLTLDDIAFLQYTGGTTGVSKGAVLTHGNMVANLQQASAWLSGETVEGTEKIITALPLYHIFSLTANCLTFMKIGGENILITNPRDFAGFVKTLSKSSFTVITGVNTLFNALLNTPGFSDVDFSKMKVVLGGGMAVQRAVADRWKEVTGLPIIEAYGLTETAPAACINPLTNTEYNGSIGVPIPSTEGSIRDDDGNELPIGEVGEICIRGPQVMRGYWERPEETEKVFFEDWLRTGDVGRMDENGYFFIEDRKKDMILVSGFNVYPNEVEAFAVTHPNIVEAAAVGVEDEHSGEVVKLFVVVDDPAVDEDAVIEHCRVGLTGYKVPKFVEFRDELPKTNVGKILRRELRDGPPA
jgi:long-chain acyl-CoA synthetase